MQHKGIIRFFAILLAIACLFALSFSMVTSHYNSKAKEYANGDLNLEQRYLDSISGEKVYLGYTLKECRLHELSLGLDLKGGMNVTLEISVSDILRALSNGNDQVNFNKAIAIANQRQLRSGGNYVDLFVEAFTSDSVAGRDAKLSSIFSSHELKDRIKLEDDNATVTSVLKGEVEGAINNSFNVLRTRIDRFGVVQPNIQKLSETGRILVELPGVKEPDRVRKLLQGTANLEFWETYNSQEVTPYLTQLDQRLAGLTGDETVDSAAVEKAKEDVAAEVKKDTTTEAKPKFEIKKEGQDAATAAASKTSEAQLEKMKKQHPLMAILQLAPQGSLSIVGYANVRDTAEINKYIYGDVAKMILPSDLKLLWGAKPASETNKNVFELYALKVTGTNGRAPLEGDVITDAKDEFEQLSGRPSVSMQMNSDGARRWAALTKANVGKAVAIVLDGVVYSAPRVNQEISGGNSQITGNFTIEDTKDLANTLKSGRMPAPARIVQEEVVGPSLGAQSIRQGIWSFVIAFVLLMIYMVLMYGFIPGMMANLALIVNLFFTLGILTSFQAALTMPGIAGIVLTLGTAVDANVLIYERIKEEMRSGKNIKQALKAGYSNAFSAIFDSNLTSIITGFILLYFGTGPVKGFATTWIIGIFCSFFTAVFLTRLAYENRFKHEKWLNLTFYTNLSKNLMQNLHIPFMSFYKKTRLVMAAAIVIFCISFAVRGLSRSIDFTGGRNYVVTFDKAVQPEEIRGIIAEAFAGSNTSAIALGTDNKTIRISTNYKIESNDPNTDDQAETILYKALKKAGLVSQANVESFKNPDIREGGSIISSTKVGPSIAKNITYGAIISVLIALVAIFLYILLRFRNVAFSVGSIVALACDTIIVLGIYSLCWGWMPFSLEIDQTFIGAILTVIGYSINDKVVVFDRIRENLKLHPKQDKQTLFNESINQTLARTVNTSLSTLIVLLCIFILAGASIRSFAFAMILGVIFGTLSSIFIASPVAYLVMGRRIKEDVKAEKK